MEDDVGTLGTKSFGDTRIGDVGLQKSKAGASQKLEIADRALLDGLRIERLVEVVDRHDLVAAPEQPLREVGSDEAGRACDEHPHTINLVDQGWRSIKNS